MSVINIYKTFKYRIRPNGEQQRKIKQFCGCSRFVFNRALAWQNEQYKQDNTFKFSYTKIANFYKDFLHKVSTEICKKRAYIYVEDLQVANMSKSTKGSAESTTKW